MEKLAHFLDSGDHSVFFYKKDEEKFDVILPFFRAGLLLGDKCLFTGSREDFAHIQEAILSLSDQRVAEALTKSLDYFPESTYMDAYNSENPAALCEGWSVLLDQYVKQGYHAIRGVGVMPAACNESHYNAIIEYENACEPLFEKYPLSAICMYPQTLKKSLLGKEVSKLSCHPYRAQKLTV
jgi:hypothetical protein